MLDEIGRGGYAIVWRAFGQDICQAVAVKVLHGQFADDASVRQRFYRGAREMARLRHPNIVRVIEEQGSDAEFYFFAMEYLPNGDLRGAVLAQKVSPSQALKVIQSVGSGLQYAHHEGIVHRDVKPANILLALDGTARLTDFDLVWAPHTTGSTRSGMLGTFIYAAPEAIYSAKDVDARADVFSLGMTLLFMLFGRELPSDAFRDPTEFIDGLTSKRSIKSALKKAVAWNRDDRFDTVAEFCEELIV